MHVVDLYFWVVSVNLCPNQDIEHNVLHFWARRIHFYSTVETALTINKVRYWISATRWEGSLSSYTFDSPPPYIGVPVAVLGSRGLTWWSPEFSHAAALMIEMKTAQNGCCQECDIWLVMGCFQSSPPVHMASLPTVHIRRERCNTQTSA